MHNNPYVGPRPYERKDKDNFFGRKREARELCALIRSEREVLFYAQSGAGKTSLLNASVIPTLEEEGFVLLPVARVGSELPLGIAADAVDNVFVFSTLLTLAGEDADSQAMLTQTLCDYLRPLCNARISGSGTDAEATALRAVVLILDQFEEIFTTHRERWQEAAGFFQQMREALDTLPNLGVVLAMREDHVAAIDPYAPIFPRRLRARFRMERLGPHGALSAVKRPAENAGCRYDPGVAERLVDNLRRIKVQQHTGAAAEEAPLGPYVEPVQLQVVCSRLWENLPEQEDNAIQWEEIEQYGNIDRALIDFYESAMRAAMAATDVNERQLRRWFGEQLITQAETRGLVLRGDVETAGLPNAAVDALEAQHIIRAETRAGARWYELAHDRLVEPVLQDNREWRSTYRNPLAEPTQSWLAAGRDPQQLLKGELLTQAEAYAREHPGDIIAEEQNFLVESLRQQAVEQEQARQKALRRRNTIIGMAGAIVILLGLTVWALYSADQATKAKADAVLQKATAEAASTAAIEQQKIAATAQATAEAKQKEAEEAQATAEAALITAQTERDRADDETRKALAQAQIARSRQLAAQSTSNLESALDLASLLAVEAYGITTTVEARSSLLSSLQHNPQLRNRLYGHESWVWSVAFSPDGQTLASGSNDNTIILWDVTDPRAPTPLGVPLTGHTGDVRSVAFNPDGQTLASGSSDGTIILWDVTDPRAPTPLGAPLTGHTRDVWSVAFSPDGQTLASGSSGGTIILWDVTDPHAPLGAPLTGHTGDVYSVDFSPDGQTLASAGCSYDPGVQWLCTEGEIILWDVADPRAPTPLGVPLTGHKSGVNSVAFSPDGQSLASGSVDNTIILWDVTDPRAPTPLGAPLTGHTGDVWSVAFSPDGQTLASGSSDGTIILWDVTDPCAPTPLGASLTGHASWVWGVAFSPDGQSLASGSVDSTIILWDVANPRAPAPIGVPLTGHTGDVWSVAFSPDGQTLASGSCGEWDTGWMDCVQGEIILWDIADPRAPAQLGASLTGHENWVYSVAFSPNGWTLASGSSDNTIILWDVADPRAPTQLGAPLTGHTGDVLSVVFSPDGQTLASGSRDDTIILWDVADPRALAQLRAPLTGDTGDVLSVVFSPDGQTLASGSADDTIILWDVADPRAPTPLGAPLTGHKNLVLSVVFSPDGQTLASGSADDTIILWDVADLRAPTPLGAPLTGHTDNVRSVAFSPDGQTLASGSDDGTIILWDVVDPRAPTPLGVPLTGHKSDVSSGSVAFSPNGQILVFSCWNHTIILWDVNDASWQARACQRAGRNLTWDEWRHYFQGEVYRKTCAEWPLHPSFFEAGQTLARNSSIEAAITFFTQTLTLYPERPYDPETEARQLIAPALIEAGQALASAGEIVTATAIFSQALDLDPTLDLNPEKEAQRLGAPTLIKEGQTLARAGEIEKALAAYAQAQVYNPDMVIAAASWNTLCWFGSLHGYASEVLFACDEAVTLESEYSNDRDSRGLARALTGDIAGAIKDFEAYVAWLKENGRYEGSGSGPQREEWIAELKAGRNPFEEETLQELRGE
ncbi:MAG: hypothetical protein JXR84_27020 [Anaerolineae bacterium]|nr:hypothetical protein [Anaerolineae bacterium]